LPPRQVQVRCSTLNGPSAFPHIVDGVFDTNERSDITPIKGTYSYFYTDYVGNTLYVMNDWLNGTSTSTIPNMFTISALGDTWTLDIFGNNTYTLNQTAGGPATGIAFAAAAGFGPSPNDTTPHTMYEFSITFPAKTLHR